MKNDPTFKITAAVIITGVAVALFAPATAPVAVATAPDLRQALTATHSRHPHHLESKMGSRPLPASAAAAS